MQAIQKSIKNVIYLPVLTIYDQSIHQINFSNVKSHHKLKVRLPTLAIQNAITNTPIFTTLQSYLCESQFIVASRTDTRGRWLQIAGGSDWELEIAIRQGAEIAVLIPRF